MSYSTLQHLSASLRERLSIIADHELRDRDPSLHLKKLQEASAAIEQCEAVLSQSKADAKLRHYLERRSYDKALAWLEEHEAKK
jgi:hypothetical protein